MLLVELARPYGARDSKVVYLSANILPFLVIHIAYLIFASWLPRIGLGHSVFKLQASDGARVKHPFRLHENLKEPRL